MPHPIPRASSVMNRIYGFLLLLLVLLGSTGFTIGLTFAPCFSSLCSEDFFPDATRIHIASFYALVASIACALLLRIASPWCYSISNYHLSKREIPILDKRISIGGLALAIWIVGITVVTTAFWVEPESSFWKIRTAPLDWADAQVRYAVADWGFARSNAK